MASLSVFIAACMMGGPYLHTLFSFSSFLLLSLRRCTLCKLSKCRKIRCIFSHELNGFSLIAWSKHWGWLSEYILRKKKKNNKHVNRTTKVVCASFPSSFYEIKILSYIDAGPDSCLKPTHFMRSISIVFDWYRYLRIDIDIDIALMNPELSRLLGCQKSFDAFLSKRRKWKKMKKKKKQKNNRFEWSPAVTNYLNIEIPPNSKWPNSLKMAQQKSRFIRPDFDVPMCVIFAINPSEVIYSHKRIIWRIFFSSHFICALKRLTEKFFT